MVRDESGHDWNVRGVGMGRRLEFWFADGSGEREIGGAGGVMEGRCGMEWGEYWGDEDRVERRRNMEKDQEGLMQN